MSRKNIKYKKLLLIYWDICENSYILDWDNLIIICHFCSLFWEIILVLQMALQMILMIYEIFI